MSYYYQSNLDPADRFDKLEFQLDNGDTISIRKGFYYDLTANEVARARRYVILVDSAAPADATPQGIAELPVYGSPANGDTVTWNTSLAAFVPGPPTGGGGGGGLPVGGTTGQVLQKASNTNYDVGWLTRVSSFTLTVVSNYATPEQKQIADYVCDGVDDQVEINAAIDLIKSLTPSQGVTGGRVLLLGPRFNTSNSVILKSYVTLEGEGWYRTAIRSQSTWSGAALSGIVQLDNTGGTTPTEWTTLRHLSIDGNKAAQTTVATRGLNYTVSATTGFTYNDTVHAVDFVRIIDTPDDGIRLSGPNVRANRFSNIRIERPDAAGLRTDAADSHFHNIDIGSAGTSGFFINGATNHRWTNCKAYFCGRLQTIPTSRSGSSVTGSGWRIEGPRNSLSSCEAQDCVGHGFVVGSNHNTLVGCISDSNSWKSASANLGNADGFYVENDVHFAAIQGCWAIEKNEGGRGYNQGYGIFVSTSTPLSSNLIIDVVCDANVTGNYGGLKAPAQSTVMVTGAQFAARATNSTTTSGSSSITIGTVTQGAFAVGQIVSGTGIPGMTYIGTLAGSAATLVDANGTAVTATASGSTVTLTARAYSAYRIPSSRFINVLDFGAVGDGATDDTAAIARANNSSSPGDTIFFPRPPAGNFYIVTGLTLKAGRTYTGEFSRAQTGATRILLKNATNPATGGVLTSEGFASNATAPDDAVVLRDLYIDGNSGSNTSGHGIVLMNRRASLERVRVANCIGDGIQIASQNAAGTQVATSDLYYNEIRSCHIASVGANGINVIDPADKVRNGWIVDTLIDTTGTRGINIDRARGWHIKGNFLTGIGTDGIRAQFSYRTEVESNHIEGYGASATTGTYSGITLPSTLGRPVNVRGNRINNANAVAGSTYRSINQDSAATTAVDMIIAENSIYGNGTAETGIVTTFGSATSLDVNLTGNKVVNCSTTLGLSTNATAVHRQSGNSWNFASAVPATGTWIKGTRVENYAPAVGSPTGWVCTVNGSPGTWVALANL